MTAELPQIGMLWMRGPLSFLEQLCVKSFVDAGHHTILYTYDDVSGIPDGVDVRSANEILPETGFLVHERTGSPALHSDLFRYRMLEKMDNMIWADTDAYCRMPFVSETGHFHGWESDRHINGGVLGLPQDSDTLRELLEFTRDEFAIPPWFTPQKRAELEALKSEGNPVHAGDMPWGVWGPHAVTYFLQKTGEAKYSFPQEGLYPFTFKERVKMLKPSTDLSQYITDNTYSVHFYGRRMRPRINEKEGGAPHPKSLIGQLLIKHGIDPKKAPIPNRSKVQTKIGTDFEHQKEEAIPQTLPKSLNDLDKIAVEFSSDKGSQKHRYTEAYHMVFHAMRGRKLRIAFFGNCTNDRPFPSEQDIAAQGMWLKYFPKATLISVGIDQHDKIHDPRFEQLCCDLNENDSIQKAADHIGDVDIVFDSATHASIHQQALFIKLFPKLNSGGIYSVENLRWQPSNYEKMTPDLTKTSDLFQGFVHNQKFSHKDLSMEVALNSIAPHIASCLILQDKYKKKRPDHLMLVQKA